MNWYITKLVFKIDHSKANVSQFDEQWRLLQAESEEQAMQKAHAIGERESEQMKRPDGALIHWKFLCVTDLFPFSQAIDGSEIFSRVEQPENEKLYLSGIKAKAERYAQPLNAQEA